MIQKLLISHILNPLGKQMDRCSETAKEYIFVFFGALTFFISFASNAGLFASTPYIFTFTAGCLCMGMMILSMLRADIQPIRFSLLLMGLWLSVGILITVAAVRFNADWLSDAIMYVAVCPVAFIVWGNVDHKKMFRLLIRSCIISFVIFFAICALFYPLGARQYQGFFSNPNGTSGYLAVVFACLLIYAFQEHRHIWKQIAGLVLLGLCSGVLYYTNSRSGQLAAICTFAFTGILFVFQDKAGIKQRLIYRFLPVVLSLVIFIPGTLYIMQISNKSMNAVTGRVESLLHGSQTNPTIPGESTVPGESTPEDYPMIDFDTINDSNKDRYNTSGKDFNRLTTGRADIWKAFLEKTTPWGNGEKPSFYIESVNKTYSNPHMTPLLFAYQYGWICAIAYLLFNILSGVKSICFARKNKFDSLALLPFAVTITYGIIFLLETVNTPFMHVITMFYFFIQTPLVKNFQQVLARKRAI